MEGLAIIILRKVIRLIPYAICTISNTVGIRADYSTEETLTRIIDIVINIIIA